MVVVLGWKYYGKKPNSVRGYLMEAEILWDSPPPPIY